MNNNTHHTIVLGMLSSPPYDRMHDISRRVYSVQGIGPTCHTCGGGNLEPKILVEL